MSEFKGTFPTGDGKEETWLNFMFRFTAFCNINSLGSTLQGLSGDDAASKEKNVKLYGLLSYALVEGAIGAINIVKSVADSDGYKAWQALCDEMALANDMRKGILVAAFSNCKQTQEESAEDFVARLDALIAELASVDEEPKEAMKIRRLLDNMRPVYSNLTTAISAQNLKTYREVRNSVIIQSRRVEQQEHEQAEADSYAYYGNWGSGFQNRYPSFGGRNYKGGKGAGRDRGRAGGKGGGKGGDKGGGKGGKGGAGSFSQQQFRGNCENCGEQGHTWRQCSRPYNGRGPSANLAYDAWNSENEHFTMMALSASMTDSLLDSSIALFAKLPKDSLWLLDGGSTDHLSSVRSDFFDYEPATAERFVEGINCKVEGVGSVKVCVALQSGKSRSITLKKVLLLESLV